MATPNDVRSGQAAVALRLAGASFGEIAQTLGLAGTDRARVMVEQELAAGGQDVEARGRLRFEEAARIERLMRSVWGKATNPQDPEHLVAVRTALGLIDRHARLLGLDAPSEVLVYTPTSQEIDEWVSGVLGHAERAFDVVDAEVVEDVVAD